MLKGIFFNWQQQRNRPKAVLDVNLYNYNHVPLLSLVYFLNQPLAVAELGVDKLCRLLWATGNRQVTKNHI